MRKVLIVALLAVFVIGITGLVTAADTVEQYSAEYVKNNFEDFKDDYPCPELEEEDLEDVKKVIVVSPPAFDGYYEIKTKGNGKALVLVDPIHVTE